MLLKAPLYTNFEGGARAEKTRFMYKILQKLFKNAFLAYLFKNLPAAQKVWSKWCRFEILKKRLTLFKTLNNLLFKTIFPDW